jgi:hypothetical protein
LELKGVYYTLVNSPGSHCERQWTQSIRSLRFFNREITVWLLLFNGATAELVQEAERQNVFVEYLGPYADFLQRFHPHGSVLALYPTLQKFVTLTHLPLQDLTQLLYLDCDTFFFDDVNLLFSEYCTDQWYAREEPMTRRSHYDCNPEHVNEELLLRIAQCEGLRPVFPFNTGVFLLNHGIWERLENLRAPYLALAWRLLCGWELNQYIRSERDTLIQRAVIGALTDCDRIRVLPYPSTNSWLLDEVALWLALGSLSDFSLSTLSRTHVPQGGEFAEMLAARRRCIVAHYFTRQEQDFFSAVPTLAA